MSVNEISLENAATLLGISVATARNWIRHNYLIPQKNNGEVTFNIKDINSLLDKIENGELNRLRTRANKRSANKKFIPDEHILNGETEKLNYIVKTINKNNLDIDISLFLLSINFLFSHKILNTNNLSEVLKFNSRYFENKFVLNELKEWYQKFNFSEIKEEHKSLLYIELPNEYDILGIIYQSVLLEGTKAKRGSYYTPRKIIKEISNDYIKNDFRFLDPCCGTGQFLLTVGDKIDNPENLFGIDIDYLATKIAKFNLISKFSDKDFQPNIYNFNTLLDFNDLFSYKLPIEEIDLVATNPPWGVHFSKEDSIKLNLYYPQITSFESFSYFIIKGYEYLKKDGTLSFILPEAILNVKTHKDIRKFILKNFNILKIEFLGRVFKNVFTNVIRLDLRKKEKNNPKVKIKLSNESFEINQERFENNYDNIFDININNIEETIFDKIFSHNYITLKDRAEWALGIVTGNNEKYVSDKPNKNYEPVFRGSDVNKYFLASPQRFIEFNPQLFQQVAPENKYRAKEKLIYKFISSKLVFAYDNKQSLTLNSANILIPKIGRYPIKIISAFLNSALFQFIYFKKFNSIKILRNHLETLPFPELTISQISNILEMVNGIIEYSRPIQNNLDNYIFDLFELTNKEKKYISNIVTS